MSVGVIGFYIAKLIKQAFFPSPEEKMVRQTSKDVAREDNVAYGRKEACNNQLKRLEQEVEISGIIENNLLYLLERRDKSLTIDDNGKVDSSLWAKEIDVFIDTILLGKLKTKCLFTKEELEVLIDEALISS